jgi:hypothetical protein
MSGSQRKRKQLFVDPRAQGALVLRILLYWVVCLVSVTLALLCWRIASEPLLPMSAHFWEIWTHNGAALIASFLLLPLVIYDILQMSNRFFGPLFRLRRSMRALARGEHVDPISFREGDFWPEFAQEFNALAVRVQLMHSRTSSFAIPSEEDVAEPAAR